MTLFDVGYYTQDVLRYGYRTAEVYGRFFSVRYESGDEVSKFQHDLRYLSDQKLSTDNHECYEITNSMGDKLYLQFSDNVCYFGSGITKFTIGT